MCIQFREKFFFRILLLKKNTLLKNFNERIAKYKIYDGKIEISVKF
jgi:hypothetical protein